MNKSEILNRIRNRLTLPLMVLDILSQQAPYYVDAVQEIKELMKEIEKYETTDQ